MNSNQDTCEVIIIGAGIIGLAIGAELSKKGREVIILESESKTVQHASSHNSEVIHSGVYYENNSLKAKFCVEGNPLLYDYCKKNGIDFRRSGKLIVANNEKELSSIEQLSINAKNNSVNEARILNKKDLLALEPSLIAEYALFIESTGIIDSHAFALSLEAEIENSGNHIITSTTVINGQYNGNKWELEIGGQDSYVINSEIIINFLPKNLIGLVIAFIGVFILTGAPNLEGKYFGVLLTLSGAFTWSLGAVMAKPLSKKIGAFALMTWLCVFSGPLLILISTIVNGNPIQYILSANFYSWITVIYLGFIMQPIAYGAWYYVLRKHPVNKIMPVLLLLPVTGLLTAIFLLGEEPAKQVFLGGTIIVFGVGMILFSKPKKK